MRILGIALAAVLVLSGCIYVNASNDRVYTEGFAKNHSFDISEVSDIEVFFSAGDFSIVGTDSEKITTQVSVVCKKQSEACERIKREVSWGLEQNSDHMALALLPKNTKSTSNVSIVAKLEIPKTKDLTVTMAAGSLNISNYSGCVNADLTAGSINVGLAKSVVADAVLTARVGGSSLIVDGDAVREKRKLLVGSKTEWSEGKGDCHVALSTDAGEVNLKLN